MPRQTIPPVVPPEEVASIVSGLENQAPAMLDLVTHSRALPPVHHYERMPPKLCHGSVHAVLSLTQRRVVARNDAAATLIGYKTLPRAGADPLGLLLPLGLQRVWKEQADQHLRGIKHVPVPEPVEVELTLRDHHLLPLRISMLLLQGPRLVLLHLEDMQRELHLRHGLHRMAITDSLTGLHNRGYLENTLVQALARRTRALRDHLPYRFALLFLDLDNFKQVNDKWGHAAGDQVLRALAQSLKHVIRLTDTLAARYGGDEFVLFLDSLRAVDDVAIVRQRLLDACQAPIDLGTFRGPTNYHPVISIGKLVSDNLEERQLTTVSGIMDYADVKMYREKRQKRE